MHSILISGAAQGIGAATAMLFYQHGYKVGIYDINVAQAEQLAQQLPGKQLWRSFQPGPVKSTFW